MARAGYSKRDIPVTHESHHSLTMNAGRTSQPAGKAARGGTRACARAPRRGLHAGNPFALDEHAAYARWRRDKLEALAGAAPGTRIDIKDPQCLTHTERGTLTRAWRVSNMAFYRCRPMDEDAARAAVRSIGRQLGLGRLDRTLCAGKEPISAIRVRAEGPAHEYIPYSNRPIRWHTDGYYNAPHARVRGFIMHCVSPAIKGGANRFLDPELVYMRLRDEEPAFIAALMHPRALSIPANRADGTVVRAQSSGPVFSVDPAGGTLHMRYTARKRSIAWRDDRLTVRAVRALEAAIEALPRVALRLGAGEGIVANNVLHAREGFIDDERRPRVLLRARYYERVRAT